MIRRNTYRLKDGSYDIGVTELTNYSENSAEKVDTLVVGNGAWSRPQSYGALARQLLKEARDEGRDTRIVSHGDPWFGRGVYAQDYRTDRLAAVAAHAANSGENPVSVIGHSWSWPSAVQVALAQSEETKALFGYTPTGHRGKDAEQPPWRELMKAVLTDYKHSERARFSPSSLIKYCVLGANVVSHLASGYSTVTEEVAKAFSVDVTDEVLKVRAQGTPVGMALAEHEFFFPVAPEQRSRLDESGVFFVNIGETTHSSALVKPENGAVALYGLVRQLA